MAIVETVNSTCWWDYAGGWNYGPTQKQLNAWANWAAELFWAAELLRRWRVSMVALKQWHERALEPWCIVAKRFDFRAAPRWSSNRWRSKT